MSRIFFCLVCGLSLAGLLRADDAKLKKDDGGKSLQPKVLVTEDLVFANVDGRELKLDLYLPAKRQTGQARQSLPLVVWIHGGGWRAGSHKRCPIQAVTEHGFALASISYRFTDTAIFPAQIHDCKAAIRWLRANADRLGYDASWIAVAGSSAGGHLALLVGVSANVDAMEGTVGEHDGVDSSVQAIVDYFGPSDFVLRGQTQPERAYTEKSGSLALLGGLKNGKVDPVMERDASPTKYISADDPPLLIFHGTNDQTVLLDQSEQMAKKYADAGLVAKLVVIEKAGHGGQAFYRDSHFQTLVEFLQKHRPPVK